MNEAELCRWIELDHTGEPNKVDSEHLFAINLFFIQLLNC